MKRFAMAGGYSYGMPRILPDNYEPGRSLSRYGTLTLHLPRALLMERAPRELLCGALAGELRR